MRPLIAFSWEYPPYVNPCFEEYLGGNCTEPGVEIQLIEWVMRRIGVEVRFRKTELIDYGDVLRMILNGTADFLATSATYREDLVEELFFSIPVEEDYPVFLVKQSATKVLPDFLLFSLADWKVWALSLLTCLLFTVFSETARRCISKHSYFYRMVKFVKTSWYVLIGILLACYTGILSVKIAVLKPPMALPFADLGGLTSLLLSRKCSLVLYQEFAGNNLYAKLISSNESDTELAEKTRKALAYNPPLVVANAEEMMSLVVNDTGCLIGVEYGLSEVYLRNKFCGYAAIVDPNIPRQQYVYYFGKDSPAAELIKKTFASGSVADFYRGLFEKYVQRDTRRLDCDGTESLSSQLVLSLQQLQDSFWLLLIGFFVSVFLFLYEIGWESRRKECCPRIRLCLRPRKKYALRIEL